MMSEFGSIQQCLKCCIALIKQKILFYIGGFSTRLLLLSQDFDFAAPLARHNFRMKKRKLPGESWNWKPHERSATPWNPSQDLSGIPLVTCFLSHHLWSQPSGVHRNYYIYVYIYNIPGQRPPNSKRLLSIAPWILPSQNLALNTKY